MASCAAFIGQVYSKTNDPDSFIYQPQVSGSPTGKYNAGDFAAILDAQNGLPTGWGQDGGTHGRDGRQWRIADCAQDSTQTCAFGFRIFLAINH